MRRSALQKPSRLSNPLMPNLMKSLWWMVAVQTGQSFFQKHPNSFSNQQVFYTQSGACQLCRSHAYLNATYTAPNQCFRVPFTHPRCFTLDPAHCGHNAPYTSFAASIRRSAPLEPVTAVLEKHKDLTIAGPEL